MHWKLEIVIRLTVYICINKLRGEFLTHEGSQVKEVGSGQDAKVIC